MREQFIQIVKYMNLLEGYLHGGYIFSFAQTQFKFVFLLTLHGKTTMWMSFYLKIIIYHVYCRYNFVYTFNII
jgi:hypothetical protein